MGRTTIAWVDKQESPSKLTGSKGDSQERHSFQAEAGQQRTHLLQEKTKSKIRIGFVT